MIFKVPEEFEGSFVLSSIGRSLTAGVSIDIYGSTLYAPDIKAAIRQGILVPEKEYSEEQEGMKKDVMIVNKTDRIMVLNKLTLRPNGSAFVDRDEAAGGIIKASQEKGFIEIISIDETVKTTKKTKKKTKKKKAKKKVKKAEKKEVPKMGEDREVTPKVWNFRSGTAEDAQFVPKSEDIVKVDTEVESETDFIDKTEESEQETPEVMEVVKVAKVKKKAKKKIKKKKAKKKAVKKTIKKKGKATKKKKVKTIEPVGDKKVPKTEMDAAIELDSRGNVIEKASDVLEHMIEEYAQGADDISFADNEQGRERLKKRTDMG